MTTRKEDKIYSTFGAITFVVLIVALFHCAMHAAPLRF